MSVGRCSFLLLLYSIAAVFVIVGGQPTTDDDYCEDDQLTNNVANLQTQLKNLVARNLMLEAKVTKLEADKRSDSNCVTFS